MRIFTTTQKIFSLLLLILLTSTIIAAQSKTADPISKPTPKASKPKKPIPETKDRIPVPKKSEHGTTATATLTPAQNPAKPEESEQPPLPPPNTPVMIIEIFNHGAATPNDNLFKDKWIKQLGGTNLLTGIGYKQSYNLGKSVHSTYPDLFKSEDQLGFQRQFKVSSLEN
jgi:hypothetical protein